MWKEGGEFVWRQWAVLECIFFFKPSLLEKAGSHLLYLGDRREEEKKGGKGRRRERRRGKRRRGRGEERRVTPGES